MGDRAEVDTLKGWPTPSLTRPRLIDSGGCTRPGALNGKALKSQDRALVGWAGDIFVAAVFDGHGLGGEVASEACVECLERAVGNPFLQVRFGKAPSAAMAELFWMLDDAAKKAHANAPHVVEVTDPFGTQEFRLEKGVHLDALPDGGAAARVHGVYVDAIGELDPLPVDFGCAAVVSIVVDGRVVTGSVGDVGALALSEGPPIVLTPPEHTLDNDGERERIRKIGDVVEFTEDGFWRLGNQPVGTETRLTRSLGHEQLSQGGMSPCPAISVLEESAVATLVLCSGGVTSALRPEQLSTAAGSLKDTSKDVAERLVLASQVEESADFLLDDCTVAVVKLHEPEEISVKMDVPKPALTTGSLGRGKSRAKQRLSQRRKKGPPQVETGKDPEWTVKDSAWAWGLGSFRIASIPDAARNASKNAKKTEGAQQRKPSKSAEIRAKIAAEDERVRQLEARMSMVVELEEGGEPGHLRVPQGRFFRSDTLKSERYGFKS